MKKTMISAAIAALLAVGGYFVTNTTSPSEEGMSDLMLANAEALSDPEVTVQYAKNCAPRRTCYCAKSSSEVHKESDDWDDPDPDPNLDDFFS